MPKQQTGADETPNHAHPHEPRKSEAASPQTAAQKNKERADRTHVTVTSKPDPSPHKIRKS